MRIRISTRLLLIGTLALGLLLGSLGGLALRPERATAGPVLAGGRVLPAPLTPGAPAVTIGSGFTYQGYLADGGSAANGSYDFQFRLYDLPTGGSQVNGTLTLSSQPVTNGLFTVELNFGGDTFMGQARWLEVAVQPAGGGGYTTLSPRTALNPVPYASYATGAELAASVPWIGITNRAFPFNGLRAANTTAILDGGAGSGNPGLTIGSDGLPIVSYVGSGASGLKVTHCTDLTCSGVTTTMVDSGSTADSAITIGSDGLPIISYRDDSSLLAVAHCTDVACTSATLATLGAGGSQSAITIGSDGLPIISYRNGSSLLAAAHCTTVTCSGATTATLDATALALYTAIAIGNDGLPIISYYDNTPGVQDLKMAHCADLACAGTPTITTLDSTGNVGLRTSLAIGDDSLPIISYLDNSNRHPKVAHCANPACTSATLTTLDPVTFTGQFSSIAVGGDGLPIIGYLDTSAGSNNLKVAHCLDVGCASATLLALASSAGFGTTLTIGADGLPIIATPDGSNSIKAIHCGSPTCVAYQHRR